MFYNTKIIDYGDYLHIEHFGHGIKRKEEGEDTNKIKKDKVKHKQSKKQEEHSTNVSVNRSKSNMFRIARSNNWDVFITLTFDQKKIDSSDYDLISKLMTKYLEKLRRKNKNLKYLVVPELHKDKKHYHFHGLLANIDGIYLDDSGHYDKNCDIIYNIPGWENGFSTATLIKNQSAVRNYLGKYITKDLMNKLKFKKRYYCSQNVNICEEEYYNINKSDLLDSFIDNLSYINTVHISGVNTVTYMEIKKG